VSLIVDSLFKRFTSFPALNGVSFTAPHGAFVALLGVVIVGTVGRVRPIDFGKSLRETSTRAV